MGVTKEGALVVALRKNGFRYFDRKLNGLVSDSKVVIRDARSALRFPSLNKPVLVTLPNRTKLVLTVSRSSQLINALHADGWLKAPAKRKSKKR